MGEFLDDISVELLWFGFGSLTMRNYRLYSSFPVTVFAAKGLQILVAKSV